MLDAVTYRITEDESVTIECTDWTQDKWAIRRRGDVMNKQGKWEHEPMPSSRTEEFLKRTRFDSAYKAYRHWKGESVDES